MLNFGLDSANLTLYNINVIELTLEKKIIKFANKFQHDSYFEKKYFTKFMLNI